MFIELLFANPQWFLQVALIVVFSICCHEFGHAWVAFHQGDPTAAEAGHLTLNPLKQMGPFSLLMLALVGIAWGQVPVNPARMRHRWSNALVAFAGPATNLLLFLVFVLATAIALNSSSPEHVVRFFKVAAVMNMLLFMINMMPMPPLDGWTMISGLFPKHSLEKSEFLKGASLVLLILLFVFINKISMAAAIITQLAVEFCYAIF